MAAPIYNPIIPYVGPIPSGRLTPGSLIRISGTPLPNASCFAINLQCGPSVNPRDDLALHLSPVFSPPQRIVRNSLQYSQWGPEESSGGFPLASGTPFEFMILVDSDHFKIALNGQHFCEFHHRIPLERISHISIDGQVSINMLSFENNSGASAPPPMPSAPPTYGDSNMPPYPVGPTMGMPNPSAYGQPPVSGPGYPPGPQVSTGGYPPGPPVSGAGYPPASGAGYPPASGAGYPPASGAGYPSASGYPSGPSAGPYPQQSAYPSATGGYPSQYPGQGQGQYPGQGQGQYPQSGYPSTSSSNTGKGILGGLAAGAGALAAGMAGSKLAQKTHMTGFLGGGHGPMGAMGGMLGGHHKKSSPIPIGAGLGGLAAGAGAAALGAAVLGHKPLKKMKKLYKHKHYKPKFGKWKHKGWSSSSSSEEE